MTRGIWLLVMLASCGGPQVRQGIAAAKDRESTEGGGE